MQFKKNSIVIITIIVLAAAIEILTPIYTDSVKNNWNQTVVDKVNNSQEIILNEFLLKQRSLLVSFNSIKKTVKENFDNNLEEPFKNLIAEFKSPRISYAIFDVNGEIIKWSNDYFLSSSASIDPEKKFTETYFYTENLYSYLSIYDTISYSKNIYYLHLNLLMEKRFKLSNNFFSKISFRQDINNLIDGSANVKYYNSSSSPIDGRYYSVDILNNFNNKIGSVTFRKPTLENEINRIEKIKNIIHKILFAVFSAFILVFFWRKVKMIENIPRKLMLVILLLLMFRILLFKLSIFNIVHFGGVFDSSYFSSPFGYGIVKSPFEFFITMIFVLVISSKLLMLIKFFSKQISSNPIKSILLKIFIILTSLTAFMLLYRALGASVRSIIFDSSLKYFKALDLFPGLPGLVMVFNLLMLGISIFILILGIFEILFTIKVFSGFKKTTNVLFYFTLFMLGGYFFDLVQVHPQSNSIIRNLFISLTFISAYVYSFNSKMVINFTIISFCASVITTNLMIYHNNDLERESLKVTALEITRPNEEWLNYLVTETIFESETLQNSISAFKDSNANYYSEAFKIWSSSILQNEGVVSEINFLNVQKEYLGGFNSTNKYFLKRDWEKNPISIEDLVILEDNYPDRDAKIIRGIFPIQDEYALLGYIEVSCLYDLNNLNPENSPNFLKSGNIIKNSAVEFEKLQIFDFHNGFLYNKIGHLSLTKQIKDKILNVEFNDFNESWLELKIDDENYFIFVIKVLEPEFERVVAITLQSNDLAFSLFNFFKIFFIHSLLILSVPLFIVLVNIFKNGQKFYNFRTQLFSAFILVSIIPLIILAVYLKNLTKEKNNKAVNYKLSKRAGLVQSFLDKKYNSDDGLIEMLNNASEDLNVNFTLYLNGEWFYSSVDPYFKIGLFPSLINYNVFQSIFFDNAEDIIMLEDVEDFKYNSYYKLVFIGDDEYIIKVTDLFNNVTLPMTGTEIDVFLFGTYSFVILLILLISTLLSNQISYPVRRLTLATKSIAAGDLSIQLKDKSNTEVHDLVVGFNSMVRELKKNQNELAEMERETAWKEMAKQVAHEIKNPLTPMKLSIQHLIATYNDDSNKFKSIFEKVTNSIIHQIETLRNIASEFSNFARMPNIKIERINLKDIIDRTLSLFSEESVKISINSKTEEFFIQADFDQCKRLLINLVRNSIQAKASIVNVDLDSTKDYLVLKISDDGEGIPPQFVEKIFESEFTTKQSGMGIGLTMAKRFLDNIGASIKVQESNSSGTVIVIKFQR